MRGSWFGVGSSAIAWARHLAFAALVCVPLACEGGGGDDGLDAGNQSDQQLADDDQSGAPDLAQDGTADTVGQDVTPDPDVLADMVPDAPPDADAEVDTGPPDAELGPDLQDPIDGAPDLDLSEVAPDPDTDSVADPDAVTDTLGDAAVDPDAAPDAKPDATPDPDTTPDTTPEPDIAPDQDTAPDTVSPCPTSCDDANTCTTDTCDPGMGCVHAPAVGACDDGNGCTLSDACGNGSCIAGSAKDCNDQNACTTDACDVATGTCSHKQTCPPNQSPVFAPLPDFYDITEGTTDVFSPIASDPDDDPITWSADVSDCPFATFDAAAVELTSKPGALLAKLDTPHTCSVTLQVKDSKGATTVAKLTIRVLNDEDADGTADPADADLDGDGVKNADEPALGTDPKKADTDADGASDGVDNCPSKANPTQADADADKVGDACDTCNGPDPDQDGACGALDNCPNAKNIDQADGDGDKVGNVCDNCATTGNTLQTDLDKDGKGTACDDLEALPTGTLNQGTEAHVDLRATTFAASFGPEWGECGTTGKPDCARQKFFVLEGAERVTVVQGALAPNSKELAQTSLHVSGDGAAWLGSHYWSQGKASWSRVADGKATEIALNASPDQGFAWALGDGSSLFQFSGSTPVQFVRVAGDTATWTSKPAAFTELKGQFVSGKSLVFTYAGTNLFAAFSARPDGATAPLLSGAVGNLLAVPDSLDRLIASQTAANTAPVQVAWIKDGKADGKATQALNFVRGDQTVVRSIGADGAWITGRLPAGKYDMVWWKSPADDPVSLNLAASTWVGFARAGQQRYVLHYPPSKPQVVYHVDTASGVPVLTPGFGGAVLGSSASTYRYGASPDGTLFYLTYASTPSPMWKIMATNGAQMNFTCPLPVGNAAELGDEYATMAADGTAWFLYRPDGKPTELFAAKNGQAPTLQLSGVVSLAGGVQTDDDRAEAFVHHGGQVLLSVRGDMIGMYHLKAPGQVVKLADLNATDKTPVRRFRYAADPVDVNGNLAQRFAVYDDSTGVPWLRVHGSDGLWSLMRWNSGTLEVATTGWADLPPAFHVDAQGTAWVLATAADGTYGLLSVGAGKVQAAFPATYAAMTLVRQEVDGPAEPSPWGVQVQTTDGWRFCKLGALLANCPVLPVANATGVQAAVDAIGQLFVLAWDPVAATWVLWRPGLQ